MAGTGTLQVAYNVTNLPTGSESFTSNTTAANAVAFVSTAALSSGNNTISLPTGITKLVIIGPNGVNPTPNPAYAGVLTLKGSSGDTGTAFSAQAPLVICWDATGATAPSTIVINATVATTVYLWGM